MDMSIKINDQHLKTTNVNKSKYGIPEIIAYISKDEWIHPTDLIGLGTVEGGSGFELNFSRNP